MQTLKDKRALVTGAASGIGRAIALELARLGTHLVLADRDQVGLANTLDEVRKLGVEAWSYHYDAAQPEQVASLARFTVEQAKGIDLLVNNAGISYHGITDKMSFTHWEELLQVNLHAPVRLTHELLPYLMLHPEAHILNVCSVLGLVGLPKVCAYSTTKFALVGFSEALRAEYGKQGIGVTALCPGLVKTNLFRSALSRSPDRQKAPPEWVCTTPEKVARSAIRGIQRNQALVVVEPIARLLTSFKRLTPRLFDWALHLGSRRHTLRRLQHMQKRMARELATETEDVRHVA